MVKKLKQMANKKAASTGNLLDNALAGSVKDSAQQIWLAGMGAFSKAQEEGGKVFEALVKEGMSLQKKTQGLAEDRINAVTSKRAKDSGVRNFQLKESIWSIRIRIMVYLTHMMIQ